MEKYQNILVAVDGSEEAKRALTKAAGMAAENNAHLIIVHVADLRYLTRLELYERSIVSEAEKHGREMLDNYKEEAKKFGAENISTVLEFGSPRMEIPKNIAAKYEADLIVVGATGLNAVERLLIGSVSEAIIRHATCDVLIARTRNN
ncbi:universal stress protein [Bacillus sp. PK3_68]|uniref:universal stress protein n=1 Tax=Bacillaceae TaxID=186817 RepID=UPI000E75787E|nr:universal stress protein [Bacillus sp. PK3_68]RJS61351.1 universal stress protein UspA [Bacillus sp. PK3_68]